MGLARGIGRLSEVGALWNCVPRVLVVGATVPAAVCRWGQCLRCPGVGRFPAGLNMSNS